MRFSFHLCAESTEYQLLHDMGNLHCYDAARAESINNSIILYQRFIVKEQRNGMILSSVVGGCDVNTYTIAGDFSLAMLAFAERVMDRGLYFLFAPRPRFSWFPGLNTINSLAHFPK